MFKKTVRENRTFVICGYILIGYASYTVVFNSFCDKELLTLPLQIRCIPVFKKQIYVHFHSGKL